MLVRTVAKIGHLEIVELERGNLARYRIQQGSRYVGKTSDGGYLSKAEAIAFARKIV